MDVSERLDLAVYSTCPFVDLLACATALQQEGMSQDELKAQFEILRIRFQFDTDELRYNAVLDVLDFIVGWCPPGKSLYPIL